MSSTAADTPAVLTQSDRLEVLFEELSELAGHRNAIDARIVEIAAKIDREGLLGITGAPSVTSLIAWKTGCSPHNAETVITIADRQDEFPRCVTALREGRLSLDQVGVIAERAGEGSDEHYAQLAESASVTQLRTALKQEPRPEPEPVIDPLADDDEPAAPPPAPRPEITSTSDADYTYWRIKLTHDQSAKFTAALQSHKDGLIASWKRDHGTDSHSDTGDHSGTGRHCGVERPPLPSRGEAFMALVEAGWDAEVLRRPHGQHTTVVVHVDVENRFSALHLGPALTDEERRYLSCDATCEVWFERHGRPIGAGRSARTVNRRLRRALEHRDRTCVVPGCGATRGLHAHHIVHWEDGGETELDNLVLVCPYHHRAHHRGIVTITGPARKLLVTDHAGRELKPGSLARPPTTPPPNVAPYPGSSGERAQWKWYRPYEPPPPMRN
ncbi:HNH endonuclease signature motif containing protein [Mycobacterium sp. ITM-2016-00317]|uniref:HNH endonuclease signature motif containing protein n=1 Tax=Mycobacterium sp. ITM-2016-00317 TaxID=2099694 RepID=UPI00287FAFEA|nr:HNH endonuclease signature motif containing protein [Mycobacterium sp. ITM-2016-00317]WNG87768.1 HNH endonuclease signature motif containing protein [Mycobacterium sp. ITM-2016-00317]